MSLRPVQCAELFLLFVMTSASCSPRVEHGQEERHTDPTRPPAQIIVLNADEAYDCRSLPLGDPSDFIYPHGPGSICEFGIRCSYIKVRLRTDGRVDEITVQR